MRIILCIALGLSNLSLFAMELEIFNGDNSERWKANSTDGLMLFSDRIIHYGSSNYKRIGEDRHFESFNYNFPFFSVYDGHAGPKVAQLVSEILPQIIQQMCIGNNFERDFSENTIKNAFEHMQKSIPYTKHDNSGTTASTVFFSIGRENNILLHVAHIGDSRVVLGSNGRAYNLTADHNTSNQTELDRIEKVSKKYSPSKWKSRSGVELTRRFAYGKQVAGLIAEPDVLTVAIAPADAFVIIATDGLWDNLTSHNAVSLVYDYLTLGYSAKTISQNLISVALNRDIHVLPSSDQPPKHDDITVTVVLLRVHL